MRRSTRGCAGHACLTKAALVVPGGDDLMYRLLTYQFYIERSRSYDDWIIVDFKVANATGKILCKKDTSKLLARRG